jgi:hypothetical protein
MVPSSNPELEDTHFEHRKEQITLRRVLDTRCWGRTEVAAAGRVLKPAAPSGCGLLGYVVAGHVSL